VPRRHGADQTGFAGGGDELGAIAPAAGLLVCAARAAAALAAATFLVTQRNA
jgi:hypothetical protein